MNARRLRATFFALSGLDHREKKMLLRAAALRRASDLVGLDALSSRLGTDRRVLACWMLLEGLPPASAFLKSADIIFEHQLAALSRHA